MRLGLYLHLNLVDTGDDIMLVQTVTLTNDQIKALPTTPIEIVAAPGAGKYIFPMACIIETDFSHGILDNVSSGLSIDLGSSDIVLTFGDNVVNACRAVPIALLNGIGNLKNVSVCEPVQPTYPRVPAETDTWANVFGYPENDFDQIENLALKLSADNADGNFTGGHASNSLLVRVYYVINSFLVP